MPQPKVLGFAADTYWASRFNNWIRNQMAIPEFGQGIGIASLVAWVAGPQSRFMTGAILTIGSDMNT